MQTRKSNLLKLNAPSMKKNVSFYARVIQSLILMCFMPVAVAQGLYSNTSQSTQYVRMLSRNASTAIDAVYYNPAGLGELSDGWHFALNDQVVFQTNTITSGYPLLDNDEYSGRMTSPFVPSAFGAYKMGNVVISLGAGMSAGGGKLAFEGGMPAYETPLSRMIPELAALSKLRLQTFNYDLSAYEGDTYYEDRTIYSGIQAGVTYLFNEVLSGFAGVRYISGSGTYIGHIFDAQLNVDGDWVYASEWLPGTVLPAATLWYNRYGSAASSVQQLITLGAGSYTLAQVQTLGFITSVQRATYEAYLSALGYSSAQIAAMNMNQIKSQYTAEANNLSSAITGINAAINNAVYKEMNATQRGAGWTPILGMNLNVDEKINVGMRYEFVTKLAVANSSPHDDFGLYPDHETVEIVIPSMLSLGIGYKPMDLLEAQLSFDIIFDKSVKWGLNTRDQVLGIQQIRTREVAANTWQLALGLQYDLRNDLALSLGAMTLQPGVSESFQSEFGYVCPSVTIGAGLQWRITGMLTLDAGIMNSFCQDVDLTFTDEKLQEYNIKYPAIYSGDAYESGEYTEKLSKRHLVVSAGITYSIFRTEK
jgi:long-subunit fatty acid transport protein